MPPTDYTKPDSSAAASAGIPPSLLRVHDSVALEVEIRSSIKLREEYLARLTALCGPDVSPTDLQQNLLDTIGVLDLMRNITVEIVESITRWRRGLPRPFPWQGSQAAKTSYLMKRNDTKFLAQQPALEGWLGMSLGHNPFFTLNVKCRQQARKTWHSRAETRVRAEASTHPLPQTPPGLIPRGSPASCRGWDRREEITTAWCTGERSAACPLTFLKAWTMEVEFQTLLVKATVSQKAARLTISLKHKVEYFFQHRDRRVMLQRVLPPPESFRPCACERDTPCR